MLIQRMTASVSTARQLQDDLAAQARTDPNHHWDRSTVRFFSAHVHKCWAVSRGGKLTYVVVVESIQTEGQPRLYRGRVAWLEAYNRQADNYPAHRIASRKSELLPFALGYSDAVDWAEDQLADIQREG